MPGGKVLKVLIAHDAAQIDCGLFDGHQGHLVIYRDSEQLTAFVTQDVLCTCLAAHGARHGKDCNRLLWIELQVKFFKQGKKYPNAFNQGLKFHAALESASYV